MARRGKGSNSDDGESPISCGIGEWSFRVFSTGPSKRPMCPFDSMFLPMFIVSSSHQTQEGE